MTGGLHVSKIDSIEDGGLQSVRCKIELIEDGVHVITCKPVEESFI